MALRLVTHAAALALLASCGGTAVTIASDADGGTGERPNGTTVEPPGQQPGNGSGNGVGGSDAGTAPGESTTSATGCDGAKLLPRPEDPGARGPWAVGARTVTVGTLQTEVWYPAKVGSEAGKTKDRYDVRLHLPDADRTKIPDAENPWQDCDCYRDLPLDEAHGPYPAVVFIHGTASFRTQSLTQMTHWASRGFIVVAADHPGLRLKDLLGSGGFPGGGGGNAAREGRELLETVAKPEGELAFLAGHVDGKQLGASGHSAGGNGVAGLGDRARVLIPMAAGGAKAGAALVSTLVLGGQEDRIVQYSRSKSGYESSPTKKRLVGLAKAGHLAFSDLCFIGRDRGGILKIAQDNGVNVPFFIGALARDGCGENQLTAEQGWAIVNSASTAVLEETLTCSSTSAARIAKIQAAFPAVAEYAEAL